ncbi:hypothetical protein, partial [Olegusella massiliensis]|uniref:hypothetical protein n=1 Tax=Olegusella massiliensis TaxID=1776381 RepID=UPI0023F9CC8D
MNIKFHSSVVACGLAFALGVASPAIALASDTTVNGQTQNESAVVSQALQDSSASIVQEIPQAQLSPVQSDVSKEVGTVTTLQEDSVPSQSQSDELPVQEEASLEESKSAQTASANNERPQAEENKLTSRGAHTSEEPVEEDPLPALPEDGWHTNEDGTLSYYKNGAFLTGLQILGDDTYYFGEDGHSRRWSQIIGGDLFYFDESYKMHKGLLRWAATKDYSYFDELDGRAIFGLKGDYYFGADARSKRWTQNIDGNTSDSYTH